MKLWAKILLGLFCGIVLGNLVPEFAIKLFTSIVEIDSSVKNKNDLERIVLCDVQNKIYSNLEKCFLNLLHNSGFSNIKLEKKTPDEDEKSNQSLS